ncbi:nucleotidyltransferase family protein [Neolewinella sp.]|uniref:nucleotidyltransferase family protein n=1 Tax=Neolewinella sp. TaxID=2993543 RepID=UPI003B51CE89
MHYLAVVVLAAGRSSRMGRPKQLLPWKGTTLLRHAVEQARGLNATVYVVLGAHHERLRNHLAGTAVCTTINERFAEGMTASIRCGVEAVMATHQQLVPLLFMLVDQPQVDTAYLQRLVTAHRQYPQHIIATAYPNKPGVPALFPADNLVDLLALTGEAGAGTYLAGQGERVRLVQPAVPFFDLDTPQDYRRRYEGD